MPKLVEINGLDEAGRIGDNILFVRIGIPLPSELEVVIRNVEYFDRLFVGKKDLRGYDSSHLLKYVRDYVDDTTFDVTVFCMRTETQLKILHDLFMSLGYDLFRIRGDLIASYGGNWNKVSEAMDSFKRFRRPSVYLESFIKALGMQSITKDLPSMSRIFIENIKIEHLLVVQIDGGYPFAFWWRELPSTLFKKGSFAISGVTHGDDYYPSMSTAGAIASILYRNPDKRHYFPIHEMGYPRDFDLSSFYEHHKTALIKPTFQGRIIFLGVINQSVRKCIPYLLHIDNRKNTFEPFYVGTDIESFFKEKGYGNPGNTIIVYGKLASQKDKDNLKFSQDRGYPTRHISEFKDSFEKLVNDIELELQVIPLQKRTSLLSKLRKIESTSLAYLQ